ncbi:MAG: DUF4124 domain-containing protein [Methylobacter sp.]|nr:DUF4124 domain-containing protein [Methylobacter sp.]
MKKLFITAMFSLAVPGISQADIYKFQDADGRIYYTAKPKTQSFTRIIKTGKAEEQPIKKTKKNAKKSTAKAPVKVKPTLIVSDTPFMQGGIVEISEHKTEKGILNKVHYHFFYTDGSGSFSGTSGNTLDLMEPTKSNWSTGCKKDPITDKKMCHMKMKDLRIYVFENGGTVVSIGEEHFPGSSVAIRIDSGTPLTTSSNNGSFPLDTSTKIIEQIQSAKSLTTRYMKWPYQSWVDESWEIFGFNETFKYINWAIMHIK